MHPIDGRKGSRLAAWTYELDTIKAPSHRPIDLDASDDASDRMADSIETEDEVAIVDDNEAPSCSLNPDAIDAAQSISTGEVFE
jgi:hypothetical protein